jgi:hypothetical protein
VAPGVDYINLDRNLMSRGGSAITNAVATWRPRATDVSVSPASGAGQFRALGRIITLSGLEEVQRAVRAAEREMMGTGVKSELLEVIRLLGGEVSPGDEPGDPTVVVISSIAGGTGAGAVIDVCDVIRSLDNKWADQSFGFLFAPDVFNDLAEEHRRGVRANALGTLAELMNGYWNNLGNSEETRALFSAFQVTLSQTSRRSGPRYPFIIGAQNNNVSYKSQNEVYRAVGRSLASWVASESLQDSLTAYVRGNWTSTNQGGTSNLPLRTSMTERPFSAIGSARVGLGRDKFAEYASEHLAKSAIERIVNQHESQRQGPRDDRKPAQLIKEMAEKQRAHFRIESGLDELGPDRNEITSALRGNTQGVRNEFLALTARSLQELLAQSKRNSATSRDALSKVTSTVKDNQGRFLSTLKQQTTELARNWAWSNQDRIAGATAKRITMLGGPVTELMLTNLIQETKLIDQELSAEAENLGRQAIEYDQRVQALFSDSGKNIESANNPMVQEAMRLAVEAVIARYESGLREFARRTLKDLTNGFIEPLQRAVKAAHEKLRVEVSSENSLTADWAHGSVIPVRLQPASNEFLLEDVNNYPKVLESLLQRVAGPDVGEVEARRQAEISVLLHGGAQEESAQSLIEITDRWVPDNHELAKNYGDTPRTARFEIANVASDIETRATKWLLRGGTATERYLNEGLRDFLNPENVEPAEYDRRLRMFEGQFAAALDGAAPLVKINPAVLQAVHGSTRPTTTVSFSEIPISNGSEAKVRLKTLLEARGLWTPAVEKSFVDGGGGTIDVFTQFNEAFEPVVFDSIMKPIADEWGSKSKNAGSREFFWRWRRARPLTEFIPVARSAEESVLKEMIKGWFVALRLDQLELTPDSAKIYIPATEAAHGRWASFPSPMLSDDSLKGPNGLAITLASMVLALLEVNVRETVQPMEPYARLRELGRSHNHDHGLNAELQAFIADGANANPESRSAVASPTARQSQVVSDLEKIRSAFSKEIARTQDLRRGAIDFPRFWDLRNEILNVLDELISETSSSSAIGDDDLVFG